MHMGAMGGSLTMRVFGNPVHQIDHHNEMEGPGFATLRIKRSLGRLVVSVMSITPVESMTLKIVQYYYLSPWIPPLFAHLVMHATNNI
ncbi:unnamed protein product, partial [Allacma fusca]